MKAASNNRLWIAIALALAVMYGFRWFSEPPKPAPVDVSAEAKAYAKTLPAFDAATLETLIGNGEKPSLLYIFASWCPYCKQQHPILDAFLAKHAGRLDYAIVSLDKDKDALAAYLLSRGELPYQPYHLDKSDYEAVQSRLIAADVEYKGSIPFSVFFNAKGEKIAELPGLADADALETVLEDAAKP